MRIADLPATERPRERLAAHGTGALADRELLAVLIGTGGSPGVGAQALAERLLARFGSLAGLAKAHPAELASVTGLGRAKASVLVAAFELARRAETPEHRAAIRSSADVATGKDNYAAEREAAAQFEQFYPGITDVARSSREFLVRAVRYLASEVGVRQFLDVGTGLPTADNNPRSRPARGPGLAGRLCGQRPDGVGARPRPADQYAGGCHRLRRRGHARAGDDRGCRCGEQGMNRGRGIEGCSAGRDAVTGVAGEPIGDR